MKPQTVRIFIQRFAGVFFTLPYFTVAASELSGT